MQETKKLCARTQATAREATVEGSQTVNLSFHMADDNTTG